MSNTITPLSPRPIETTASTKHFNIDGFDIYVEGTNYDSVFQRGQRVPLTPALSQYFMTQEQQATRQLQADSCNYIYQSPRSIQFTRPETSLLPYFAITREARMASAIQFSIDIEQDYHLPHLYCCGTDIPILNPDDYERCYLYSGFVNMVLATDICLWDEMQCNSPGNPNQFNIEEYHLIKINEAFDKAAERILINGITEEKVYGLKNHPYIPTFVLPDIAQVNPVISFRRMALILNNRRNVIFDSNNSLPPYTLLLPSMLTDLLNSTVTTGGTGCNGVLTTLLGLLTGDSTTIDSGVPVTRFRVIGLRELNYIWDVDGGTPHHMGLIMPTLAVMRQTMRFHRPFRLISLGSEQRGVRRYNYYGSRVGSLEFSGDSINDVARIIIPAF